MRKAPKARKRDAVKKKLFDTLLGLVLISGLAGCSPALLSEAKDTTDKIEDLCAAVAAAPALPELAKARQLCGLAKPVVDAVQEPPAVSASAAGSVSAPEPEQ
jgi:hypothetical protein